MTIEDLERLVRPVGTGQTYKYGNVAPTIGGGMNDQYLNIEDAPLEVQYQARKNLAGGLSPGGLITDYSGSNFRMGGGRIQHNEGDARIIEEQRAGRMGEEVRSRAEIAAHIAAALRNERIRSTNQSEKIPKYELPPSDLTPEERLLSLTQQGGNQLPKTKDEQQYELEVTKQAMEARMKKLQSTAEFYNDLKRKGHIRRGENGELLMLQEKEVVDQLDPTKTTIRKDFLPFSASQKQEYLQGLDRGLINREPEGSYIPAAKPPPPSSVPTTGWWNKRIEELPQSIDAVKMQIGNAPIDVWNSPFRALNKGSEWLGSIANKISGGVIPGARLFPRIPLAEQYIPQGSYLSPEEIAARMAIQHAR